MKAALARHDELLRDAIESHGGHVVKTTGDGVHGAFATADDAVAAAVDGQRALAAEPWGPTGALRVRMGLHTGSAQQREGDYYGPALNRAARLMSVASPGQVLSSQATADLVRDALPRGVALVDLGGHQLRDLARPEVVFQVTHPDLPADFPAIRTLDAPRGNLPRQVTSFIGRDGELARIESELEQNPVVTLTGVGGVGKTRLALAGRVPPRVPMCGRRLARRARRRPRDRRGRRRRARRLRRRPWLPHDRADAAPVPPRQGTAPRPRQLRACPAGERRPGGRARAGVPGRARARDESRGSERRRRADPRRRLARRPRRRGPNPRQGGRRRHV